jgi:hypothetical protein
MIVPPPSLQWMNVSDVGLADRRVGVAGLATRRPGRVVVEVYDEIADGLGVWADCVEARAGPLQFRVSGEAAHAAFE